MTEIKLEEIGRLMFLLGLSSANQMGCCPAVTPPMSTTTTKNPHRMVSVLPQHPSNQLCHRTLE